MKRILILTYYYKQKNAMASVRSIKLSKYLSRLGYDVTVLTSLQKDTWTKDYIKPVPDQKITEVYAPQVTRWTIIQKFINHRKKVGNNRADNRTNTKQNFEIQSGKKKISLKTKITKKIKWFFYFNLAKQEDICMFHGLKREIKRNNMREYDVVISTYPTYGAFQTGIWMKKTNRCKKFISDFRDPLYNPGFRNTKIELKYDLKCLKNVIKYSDCIVCVSNGIADGIKESGLKFNKAISIITNGFDPDDIELRNRSLFEDELIHFVYTGTLYHGKRCVNMLCIALKKLVDDNLIAADSFVIDYAGPDFYELNNQVSPYGFNQNIVEHGYLSREDSIDLQQKANALLLLTWNEKQYQGVIPGKLFEYMTGKNIPIIALITGDVSNSEVKKIINESDCGIACEESVPKDIDKLTSYLLELIQKKLVHNRSIDKYNYANIAEKYSKLLG